MLRRAAQVLAEEQRSRLRRAGTEQQARVLEQELLVLGRELTEVGSSQRVEHEMHGSPRRRESSGWGSLGCRNEAA